MSDRALPKGWTIGSIEKVISYKHHSFTGGPFGSDLQTKHYTREGVQIIQLQNIGDGKFINKSRVFTSEEKANQLSACNIFPGDIILAKMADPIARGCFIPDIADRFLMASDGIRVVVDKNKHDPYFVLASINSFNFRRQAEIKSIGTTRARIGLTVLKKIPFPLPPFSVQKKIAKILTTIDGVIEKTEAAIAKYKAIKQGMMYDLFTRGLDENGKLRPSFEEAPDLYWEHEELGMIPQVWKTADIISTTYLKGRIGWQGLRYEEFIDQGPYLITGTDFKKGLINWDSCYHITQKRFEEAPLIHVKNDDVLITKDGTIGKTSYVTDCPEKAVLNSGIFVMRCKNKSYVNKYLFYVLNSEIFKKWLRSNQGGSTIVHLYQRVFEKFNFPLPGPQEQKVIVERLDSIQKTIENEEKLLTKNIQIKSGLMQDLLTGTVPVKIDEKEVANA